MRQTGLWRNALSLPVLGLAASAALAQGSLEPAGPPAPTMRTLDQIDSCTPISSLPFTISSPGSYCVTSDLTPTAPGGITIGASHVTLNLRGFALNGNGSGSGVDIPQAQSNIVVRNGTIRFWPVFGVNAQNATNSQFEGLRIIQNNSGLRLGASGRVSDCVVANSGGIGVEVTGGNSTVSNCVIMNNGGGGVSVPSANSTISDSTASGNSNYGMSVASNGSIRNCVVSGNNGYGIVTTESANVSGCVASGNGISGITVGAGSSVSACTVRANSSGGIFAAEGSRIEGNTVTNNSSDGITVGSNCEVTRNSCQNNGLGAAVAGDIHVTQGALMTRIQGNSVTNSVAGDNDFGIWVSASSGQLIVNNFARGHEGAFAGSAHSADYNILNYSVTNPALNYNLTGTIVDTGNTALNSSNPTANIRM